MGHGHHIEIKQETFSMPSKAKSFTMILMILGLVLTGIGIATIDRSGASHDAHNDHAAATHETHESHDGDKSHEGHEAADSKEGSVSNDHVVAH